MLTDACQHFYRCVACGTMLKPLAGDCCVFCSYGDTPCPPVQLSGEGYGSRSTERAGAPGEDPQVGV